MLLDVITGARQPARHIVSPTFAIERRSTLRGTHTHSHTSLFADTHPPPPHVDIVPWHGVARRLPCVLFMTPRVGFIGLGIMGSRMAANLLAHGYDVTVFSRAKHHAEPLLQSGAKWASSQSALAGQVDVLFTMLPHPEAVKESALGADGFLGSLPPGSIWVNCGTVNPSFAREMAAAARSKRVRYLDAPVTGSKEPAARGELVFLVGGDAADLEECRPLLSCMGKRIVHVGDVGLGSALKMVNNVLLAVSMEAFAETAVLGQALGIPRETIFDTLVGSPVAPAFLSAKRTRIDRSDYDDADFSLRWIQKDLHLASVSAYEAGVAMPVGNVAKEIYRLAMRHGFADLDFSAIYAFLNQSTDRPAEPAAIQSPVGQGVER
jgi:3-hydroxyisobutyrate dehydrogenase/glyoxylate/succinic semialdehyde reductase